MDTNSNNNIYKCNICNSLLSFEFSVDNYEIYIYTECQYKHKKKEKLIDFLKKKIKTKPKQNHNDNNSNCSIHFNHNTLFCKTCEKKICKDCKINHSNHKIIDLNKYFFSIDEQKDLVSSILEIEKEIVKLDQLKNEITTNLQKAIESNYYLLTFAKRYLLMTRNEEYINFYNIKNLKLLKTYFQPNKIKQFQQIIQNGKKFLSILNLTYENGLNYITLNSHKNHIYTICTLSNGNFASCSSDNSIKVYNEKFEVEYSINIHSGSVYFISQLSSGNLISCSRDKTMKIIKLLNDHKFKIEQSIEGHNYAVEIVIEPKVDFLASVSYDKSFKIWQKKEEKYTLLNSIQFQNAISDSGLFKINDKEFLTLSIVNKSIKFWETENFSNICTINNIETEFSTSNIIKINQDLLCIGGIKLISFYLIKLSTHQLLLNINNNEKILSMINSFDGNFWVGYEKDHVNQYIAKYKYDGVSLIKIIEIKYNLKYSISAIAELEDGSLAIGNREGVIEILK